MVYRMAWLFGRREYAHPAFRWLITPLFRLAWIPFVALVLTGYKNTAAFIAFLAFGACSFLAEGINAVLLKRRKAQRLSPSN
jgi:hypothetical protein